MPEVQVGQANTNSTEGSVAKVKIGDYVCSLSLEQNEFGDTLPIIPTSARTERNKILYELKIRAKLTRQVDKSPVSNYKFSIKSNRTGDRVESKGQTNAQGELTFTLVTRESGELLLNTSKPEIMMSSFPVKLQEAWYESPFLITGYNVCNENDFSGELVEGSGLDEKHKDDFLYGPSGVAMQGTGKAVDGKYITLTNKPGGWKKNARGKLERLENPSAARFAYVNAPRGKFANLRENSFIAVDPEIIPKKAKVEIQELGEKIADDTGGAIDLYHIDNFLGFGKAVVKAWLKGGINGTQRRVKYLGIDK